MHLLYKTIVALLIMSTITFGGEKRVLVEIFTNSHCPFCPAAHSALDNYLATSNGNKIDFIYYHIQFPYASDQLYQHNTSDSQTKNSFYGSYSSAPQAFFDGSYVPSNSYSSWTTELDSKTEEISNFDIILNGEYTDNDFVINAEVSLTGETSAGDLTINYVVVENVIYAGNNGISDHKNVMRKIVNPSGDNINIELNETKTFSATIEKNNEWDTANLKVIVFVQSSSTKEVFQSASISYNDFTITGLESDVELQNTFSLEQNYPNPFNPTTTIKYSIPASGVISNPLVGERSVSSKISPSGRNNNTKVELKVYDMLGKEITTLVSEQQTPGSYEVNFNSNNLTSGIYYYQLRVGTSTSSATNLIQTKKMMLLK